MPWMKKQELLIQTQEKCCKYYLRRDNWRHDSAMEGGAIKQLRPLRWKAKDLFKYENKGR